MADNKNYNSPKKDNSKIILIGIIVLLLGVIGYLLYGNLEKADQIDIKTQQIETDTENLQAKTQELEELVLAYERIKMEREELGMDKDSLENQISSLKKYIADVKKGNAKAIKDLNNTIANLKADLDRKDSELVKLRYEKDSLITNIQTVSMQTVALNDSVNSLKTIKSSLEEQVAIASILKAENIKITVINSKNKELDKEEFKAKNINKLKVSFNLGENRVARKDKKNIVMRLIEPNGSALFDLATGGGFFMVEGKEIPYTSKQNITFDNTKQNVTFIYLKGSPYKPGKYQIELYADGYKIGESSIQIK